MEKKLRLLYLSLSFLKNCFQCEWLSSIGGKMSKDIVGFLGCSYFLECSKISIGPEGGLSS